MPSPVPCPRLDPWLVQYKQGKVIFTPQQIIGRALSRLGEKAYSLLAWCVPMLVLPPPLLLLLPPPPPPPPPPLALLAAAAAAAAVAALDTCLQPHHPASPRPALRNCEHFCIWCCTNVRLSRQVKDTGIGAFWTGVIAALVPPAAAVALPLMATAGVLIACGGDREIVRGATPI